MKLTRTNVILIAVIAALAVAVAAFVFKGCTPMPSTDPVETGIDAGPGEQAIDAKLADASAQTQERIADIEREHAQTIAEFNDNERAKYEALRAQGPEAVSRWLVAFNRRLRDAGAP